MANFQELFLNFSLIALIVIGVIAFSVSYQTENGRTDGIVTDPLMNDTYNKLYNNASAFGSESDAARELFENEDPKVGLGSLLLVSIKSGGTIFTGLIVSTVNIITKLPVVLFGVDPVIISILISILVVTIILGLWIVYKLG